MKSKTADAHRCDDLKAQSQEQDVEEGQDDSAEGESSLGDASKDKDSRHKSSAKIRVYVRARPLNEVESSREEEAVVESFNNGRGVQIKQSENSAVSYVCARFLGPELSQAQVFRLSHIRKLIDRAIMGYSATVFAYGQTGAGKTFTMIGREPSAANDSEGQSSDTDDKADGIIMQAADYLFERVQALEEGQEDEDREIANSRGTVKVRATCVEIYNESVRDLAIRSKRKLHVREKPGTGFYVEGVTVVEVKNALQLRKLIRTAAKHRKVSSHAMNQSSNRSHSVMTIYIDVKAKGEGVSRYGKLLLIDLAGSERAKDTETSGETLKESGFINKSLYALSKVIGSLTSKGSGATGHVPFRDSKLTKLLIDSLGGKSYTSMIACVSPASSAVQETIRTLQFAMSVAKIKNKPVVVLDPKEKLIQDLRAEIKRLKEENSRLKAAANAGSGVTDFGSPERSGGLCRLHGTEQVFLGKRAQSSKKDNAGFLPAVGSSVSSPSVDGRESAREEEEFDNDVQATLQEKEDMLMQLLENLSSEGVHGLSMGPVVTMEDLEQPEEGSDNEENAGSQVDKDSERSSVISRNSLSSLTSLVYEARKEEEAQGRHLAEKETQQSSARLPSVESRPSSSLSSSSSHTLSSLISSLPPISQKKGAEAATGRNLQRRRSRKSSFSESVSSRSSRTSTAETKGREVDSEKERSVDPSTEESLLEEQLSNALAQLIS